MCACLVRGEATRLHLFLHPRLVTGNLVEGSVPQAVNPAVADVCDEGPARGGQHDERGERGAHPLEEGVALTLPADPLVGATDRLAHVAAHGLQRDFITGHQVDQFPQQTDGLVRREATRDVSRGVPTHAVCDDGDAASAVHHDNVLVAGPDTTHIGLIDS